MCWMVGRRKWTTAGSWNQEDDGREIKRCRVKKKMRRAKMRDEELKNRPAFFHVKKIAKIAPQPPVNPLHTLHFAHYIYAHHTHVACS